MTTKSDLYLKKAVEFEEMAKQVTEPAAKAAYEELARRYRYLAAHIPRALTDAGGDLDTLAENMMRNTKNKM